MQGDFGAIEVATPRDRNGSFEPKILSMYARAMSTRDIQGHLEEIYAFEVSPSLISEVTEAVMEDVRAWQSRPLDPVYPIVYLDALIVKMRQEGRVENRAIFVALGVNLEGNKEVLGLWTSATEGAKFWLQILTELRNRGANHLRFRMPTLRHPFSPFLRPKSINHFGRSKGSRSETAPHRVPRSQPAVLRS